MKLVISFLLGASLLAGCGAERANQSAVHTARNDAQCLQQSVSCERSHDCCSQWCVNGYCERREP